LITVTTNEFLGIGMKLLFEFLPILLFFIAYKAYDLYVATAVAIIASALQVSWLWLRHHRLERMPLITLGLLIVLGGATLLLGNETYIKWKPTVVNWLFAVMFLGSQFLGSKTFLERMMGGSMELPKAVWSRLNLAWASFFLAMGIANLLVAFNFDTNTWVNFKLFGMLGLTLAFVLGQALYMARYMRNAPESAESEE
jgi:intracellular septation protein